MAKGIRTDKLDTCAALLEDCIIGFFAGNSIQTTTHLAYAVMTMVRDLSHHYRDTVKVDLNFSTISDSADENSTLKILFQKSQSLAGDYNFSLIDRANFVKHANKNPLAGNIFLGNEDRLILSIAIEDFGSFYTALRHKGLCCQTSELEGLPYLSAPKFFKLAALFFAYDHEYDEIHGTLENKNDFETQLIAMEELKRKYSEMIQQWDQVRGRSRYDQLVLLDSLDQRNPKPTAPA